MQTHAGHVRSETSLPSIARRWQVSSGFIVATAAISLASFQAAYGATAHRPSEPCASLAKLSLSNTTILTATEIPAGSSLPAHCNVAGVIDKRVSEQDPDHFTYGIAFQLNLPDEWVGRFEMQGGGGTDGSVSSPIGVGQQELSQGWAVASDDGGHEDKSTRPYGWADDDANAGGAAHFGIDEEAREDYGYRGIAETATISKQIIDKYYGQEPDYSYMYGCSNGGRDSLMAMERSPGLFDGVIAGNPGFDLPRAALAEAWNEQSLAPLATRADGNGQPYLPDTLQPQDLEVASAAILSACDDLDGLVDGIIDNFPACTNQRVYPALDGYTCSQHGQHGNDPHGGKCLTAGQVGALKRIFDGPKNSKGESLYTTWYWDAGIWDPSDASGDGFGAWSVGTEESGDHPVNNSLNLTIGDAALPMVFMTPPAITPAGGEHGQEDYAFHFDFDNDAPRIYDKTSAYPESSIDFMAATSTDLGSFRSHGGKLIVYSSVDDGIFSGTDIVHWYESVEADNQKTTEFARLFMVPNMAHCSGGPATNSFAGNLLSSITDWVERGQAPDHITAANLNRSSPFPSGAPFDPRVAQNFPTGGTRPLCPYPLQSRYKGSGSVRDAANFACVQP